MAVFVPGKSHCVAVFSAPQARSFDHVEGFLRSEGAQKPFHMIK